MSSNATNDSDAVEAIADAQLTQVLSPILLALGLFGNVLTVLVVPRLGSLHAFSYYARVLSVSDLLLLLCSLLPRWLESLVHLRLDVEGGWLCRADVFLHRFFLTTSSLLLTAMAAQRSSSTLWPYSTRTASYRRLAKVVIVIIFIYTFFCQLGLLLHFGELLDGEGTCYLGSMKNIGSDTFGDLERWIFLTNAFVFPVLVLLCSVVLLSISIHRGRRKCYQSTQRRLHRRVGSGSTTEVVLMAALAFLLLVGPALFTELLVAAGVLVTEALAPDDWAALKQLVYANSAVHFYIYCFMGSDFRKEALNVLQCKPTEIYKGLRMNKPVYDSKLSMAHSATTYRGDYNLTPTTSPNPPEQHRQQTSSSVFSALSFVSSYSQKLSSMVSWRSPALTEGRVEEEEEEAESLSSPHSRPKLAPRPSAHSTTDLPPFTPLLINQQELDRRLEAMHMRTARAPSLAKITPAKPKTFSALKVQLFDDSPGTSTDAPLPLYVVDSRGKSVGPSPTMSLVDAPQAVTASHKISTSSHLSLPGSTAPSSSSPGDLSRVTSASSMIMFPVYSSLVSETLRSISGYGEAPRPMHKSRCVSSTW